MLQINTGKLYQAGVGRTNHLRGVLYSNLRLPNDEPIVTAAGTLTGTDALGDNRALIYNIDERIERTSEGPGALISHGIAPFLSDFAALTSFAFNAIASPDGALIDRLLSGKPGLASYYPPKTFVKRALDERIWVQEGEAEAFTQVVDELLGLDRRHFNAAMRAIRTYVSAIQRLPDDLGVAYTLMVSAIESLAHGFDGYATTWADVDERKRRPVDAALRRAATSTAAGVRAAIVSAEHPSLARRYRAFVKAHVGADYYRDPTLADTRALAACELDEALRQAYAVRSRYLHNLRILPDPLTHPFNHWEVAYVERHAVLTFQGLARLTRHVIRSFVQRGPKLLSEIYDYRREEAGIMMAELAPQYWIHRPLRRDAEATRRLEGFLEQLASAFTRQPDAAITDIREMLHDVERLAPKASAKNQGAMFALYGLFNTYAGNLRMPRFREIIDKHEAMVSRPSVEALIAFTIVEDPDKWSIETQRELLDSYFAKRAVKAGLHGPRVFESAMCLAMAERYRAVGQEACARAMIARAVDNAPGHTALIALEESFDPEVPIIWRDILLPKGDDASDATYQDC